MSPMSRHRCRLCADTGHHPLRFASAVCPAGPRVDPDHESEWETGEGERGRRSRTDPMSRLWPALKRAVGEFREDGLTDWAAALTYYGLLALFPGLIALVSIVGLVGDPKGATQTITEIVSKIGPQSAAQTFAGPIE